MEILRDQEPISFFRNWLKEAGKTEPSDPEAMTLATVGPDGQPSARMVLLKGVDEQGFRFFTNMESRKGRELSHNQKAALCFHWKSLRRQVRVEGMVSPLPAEEVNAYFKTRHPVSQLGAWASRQSRPLESRTMLEERVKEFEKKFAGQDIPCPPYWAGYILSPEEIEFWQQGDNRLHDRFLFVRKEKGWDMTRLNP